jgi:hypothetical protein
VAQSLFCFLQVDMPFELGVPDGRWMVRKPGSEEVERVVVLTTVGARAAGRRRRRGGAQAGTEEPPSVPVSRATLIAAAALPDELAAGRWLDGIDAEQEVAIAFEALNRLLAAHRIAAADPYAREVAPAQALTLRAGFGAGEQVYHGRWLRARELSPRRPSRWRRGRRATILRSQERLASVLAAPQGPLLCEEFALRARLDLDHRRLAHASSELERALSLAVLELRGEPGSRIVGRVSELRDLLAEVREIATRLFPGEVLPARAPQAGDAEKLAHALDRLEAALRARAMALSWQ